MEGSWGGYCVTMVLYYHRSAEYESQMREHWQTSQNPSPEQLKELEVSNTTIRRREDWARGAGGSISAGAGGSGGSISAGAGGAGELFQLGPEGLGNYFSWGRRGWGTISTGAGGEKYFACSLLASSYWLIERCHYS